MKKSIWIKADQGPWETRKKKITYSLECGVDTILVDEDDVPKVRELGDINIAAFVQEGESDADILVVGKSSECDATLSLPQDFSDSRDLGLLSRLKAKGRETAACVLIKGKEYEKFAAELGKICDHLIVIGTDWKVIPLENLIAALQKYDVEIIAGINNSSEAKVALETLEHGSDGVLLETKDLSEIKRTVQIAENVGVEPISLIPAKITKVKAVGMGDRVCVDTCSLLTKGEGMLIGSQSNGLFLVHGETEESPYVSPRPFRVNAGAVHAYVYVSGKTKYLSELQSGDDITVIDHQGVSRKATIGRIKIERRPLMLVEAQVKGDKIKTLLQNAETIKLVTQDGTPRAVTELKEGDEVLVHYEEGGRHFGMKIEETIIER